MDTLPAGWKPISSAPKDGTPVLAFWTGGTEAATVYGRSYGITMFKRGEWVNVDNCDDTYSEPTHWMPLPAAPGTPPATTQDAPITVSLDPDPRGVSVGVWQGSRCIYNGAHAVPVGAQDDAISAPYLQALADKVVIMNATGDPDLYREAVKDLLAAVRTFRPAPAAGDALNRLLAEKFTSGNAIPVERITITRAEYDAALSASQQQEG